MNAKVARRLRKTAVKVQNEVGWSWAVYDRFGSLVNECGKKLYRILKHNYTRYGHPLGEMK